jgi:prepilin-type N-terminal cleavage/methylation domain-containing protein
MKNQKGFALIELLAVIGISAMVMSYLVPFIFSVTKGPGTIRSEINSTLQVQNAARWITRDAKLAIDNNLEDGAEAVDNLTIQWTETYLEINEEHTVQYYVSEGELKRDCDGDVITIAYAISNIEFSQNSSVISIGITCTPEDAPEQSEQGIYHVTLRQ